MLEGKKEQAARARWSRRCRRPARRCSSRRRPGCATRSQALQNLGLRGDVDKDVQPEVFQIDPKKGLRGLRKVLGLPKTPRTIEGVDIAHLGGEDTVASLVTFIDGLPFKPGYRRYKIQTVEGVDDFASIREVVSRPLPPAVATRRSVVPGHPADRRRQGPAQRGPGGVSACWASSRRA